MNNLISVCIATYKRPLLLEKLLVSLLNQKNIDEYNLEIIVVDNDPNRTAEPVIKKFKELIISNSRYSIKYDMQPEKNIALTRNRTVELATGNYLYFIDDDEYADEYCLCNHLKVMKEFNADVTFGNVLPYFEDKTPEFIKNAKPYFRENSPDGNDSNYFITGNTMLNLKSIPKKIISFNYEYGITGGSDHYFFSSLKNKGYKFISASSSIATEFIPSGRANLSWLVKRVFRTGNNFTRTLIKNTDNYFHRFLISIQQLLVGLIQFLISIILSGGFLLFDKRKSLNWFLKAISNLGKPFAVLGIYPKEYKK
uniref:Glycosyltransferase n=1 Tax=Ignavibacterium album TaxID=591197 RepID=A0A832G6M9_9BACT